MLLQLYMCLRTKNNVFIVIGVFLLDNKIIIESDNILKKQMYRFLSKVKPNPLIRARDSNKYNIMMGILNYYNEYKNDNLEDKYLILNDSNDRHTTNYKIPMKIILANACNYLPKIEINLITNKYLQCRFKIS